MENFPTPKPRPKERKRTKLKKESKKAHVDEWFPKEFIEKYTKRIRKN